MKKLLPTIAEVRCGEVDPEELFVDIFHRQPTQDQVSRLSQVLKRNAYRFSELQHQLLALQYGKEVCFSDALSSEAEDIWMAPPQVLEVELKRVKDLLRTALWLEEIA